MATFYFNCAINTNDGDWDNLSNWWTDDTYTTNTLTLPTSSDDIIVNNSQIYNKSGNSFGIDTTVNSAIFNNSTWGIYNDTFRLFVTNGAVFNNSALIDALHGDVIFNGNCSGGDDGGQGSIYNGHVIINGNLTDHWPQDQGYAMSFVNCNIDIYYPSNNHPDRGFYNNTTVTYHGYSLSKFPLAYWKMDESSGTRTDSTGNGYSLTDNFFINQIVLSGAGSSEANGTYTRSSGEYTTYTNTNGSYISWDGDLRWVLINSSNVQLYESDRTGIGGELLWIGRSALNGEEPPPTVDSFSSIAFTYYGNGVVNDAASFDGTSYLSYYNYVEDLPLPINHNNFSVAGWVKLNNNNDNQTFFSQWNNGGISWAVGYINDGLEPESIILTVSTYSVYKINITPNIPLVVGEWYHIAFTYDGVNILLYLNSQLVGSATNSSGIYNSSAPVEIGSINGGSGRLNGSIDEVGIWNAVLTQEDIFNLYYRRDGNSYPFSKPVITQNLNDELLAWYPLDENTSTRYDFANGYDLTQNGVVGSEKGIIDNAASFVGTANNGLYNTNITTWYNWSYSYWVNVRSDFSNNPENPMFITTGNFNGGSGYSQTTYFVPISSDIIQIGHYDQFSNSIFPNVYTTKYGTWNHITLTNNTLSGISLYVNGNLIDFTNDQDVDRSWNTINLDGYRNGTYVFDGLLDDVKIWNRSITPEEIISIYKSGLPTSSKYNFPKILGIPTYTFEKVTPQTILNLPFYIKSGSGAGSLTIPLYQDGLYGKRYDGYYPDNGGVNAFGTLSVHGDEQATVDFYNFASSADFYSWQWTGYFKAPYTDDFVFRVANIDDSVDLWVGDNAISGFTSENRTTGGLYNADNSSDPIHMIGGQYYPVRLQFGEATGGDHFILEYSSSYETNVSNFQGKFFHLTDQDLPVSNPPVKNGSSPYNAGDSAYQIKTDFPSLTTTGLYWIKNININGGEPFQIYADMTTLGGGWTLILANHETAGWTFTNAISTNVLTPPSDATNLTQNYSIVAWADYIKKSPSNFDYMIDSNVRGYNGGAYTALSAYSFVDQYDNSGWGDAIQNTNGFHKNILEIAHFPKNTGTLQSPVTSVWDYDVGGIEFRMPYYSPTNAPGGAGAISTSQNDGNWWGTLVSVGNADYGIAPWLNDPRSTAIWYWVR